MADSDQERFYDHKGPLFTKVEVITGGIVAALVVGGLALNFLSSSSNDQSSVERVEPTMTAKVSASPMLKGYHKV